MIKLGQKYKVDNDKFKLYCKKFKWDYVNLDTVTVIEIESYLDLNDNDINYYVIDNSSYCILPEDCLISLRLYKLKRILSIE